MKLTQEQIRFVSDLYGVKEQDGFKLVENTDWIEDGKCSYHEIIFEFEDKTWVLYESRQGSYHTDYYYDTLEGDHDRIVYEVEKKEVITHKWVITKDEND